MKKDTSTADHVNSVGTFPFGVICYIFRQADYVAVLQDGEVAESGHYEELMARPDGLLVSLMNGEKLQP